MLMHDDIGGGGGTSVKNEGEQEKLPPTLPHPPEKGRWLLRTSPLSSRTLVVLGL